MKCILLEFPQNPESAIRKEKLRKHRARRQRQFTQTRMVEVFQTPIAKSDLLVFIKRHFRNVDKNAFTRGIPFGISMDHIIDLGNKTGWCCAITGRPFSLGKLPNWDRRPFAPSIDRIESSGAYMSGNVRLVCAAVNLAMNEWGEDVFGELARAYVERQARLKRGLELPAFNAGIAKIDLGQE